MEERNQLIGGRPGKHPLGKSHMISLLHYSAKLLFLSSPLAHTIMSPLYVRNISANSQRQKWSGPYSAMVGNLFCFILIQ